MLNHFSSVRLLWAVAHQAPLSMGFSRQEYRSGLPLLSPRDLPNPGIESVSLMSPALALTGRFFTARATWEARNIKVTLDSLSSPLSSDPSACLWVKFLSNYFLNAPSDDVYPSSFLSGPRQRPLLLPDPSDFSFVPLSFSCFLSRKFYLLVSS